MVMGRARSETGQDLHIGLFLPEGYPLMSLSLVIETLRMANLLENDTRFRCTLVSETGAPVRSSCDFPAPVSHGIADCPPVDVLLVCAGLNSVRYRSRALHGWLRRLYQNGVQVGGISSGAHILAQAGLLDGRSCSVHWESAEALPEAFHRVRVSGEIFTIDGRIITCAGGIAVFDLMLHLFAQYRDWPFARLLADLLIYPAVRSGHEPARINLSARTGVNNALVLRAIQLMEANIETPIKVRDIGREVGTSARHLERLFARSLRTPPSQYYMRLRLREARSLLSQTDLPVLQVALRCGFPNASHFTRRYREIYGVPPRDERRDLH